MSRWFALAALLLVLLAASGALSQQPVLVVDVTPGASGIDPAAVRRAIGRELGRSVSDTGPKDAERLRVDVGDDTVTVTYRTGGRELARSVELPADPDERLEVIALLAGNLARDEAAGLLEGLRPKPDPDAGAAAPEAPAGEPAPPAEPAAKPAAPKPAAKPKPATAPKREPEPAAKPAAPDLEPLTLNLSLFHPIALHPDSHERLVNIELGLVYGRIGQLSGVALDVGHLRIDRGARGVAVAPFWLRADGESRGAFVTAGLLQATGSLRGVETTGIVAIRHGPLQGAQVAGIYAESGALEGVQIAGLVNVSDESGKGLRAAGILNIQENFDGLSVAPVNFGKKLTGLHVGLLNVADDVDGVSFAPISIVKNARTQALLWGDTAVDTNVGVKYSTGRFYSLFAFAYDPIPQEQHRIGWGTAIGVHATRFGDFGIDVDVLYRNLVKLSGTGSGQADVHSTVVRGVATWNPFPAFGLFGGAGMEWENEGTAHEWLPYAAFGIQLF